MPLPVRHPPQRTGRGAPRSHQGFAPNRADRGRGRLPLPNPAGQGEKGPRRQCAATGQGRPFREKRSPTPHGPAGAGERPRRATRPAPGKQNPSPSRPAKTTPCRHRAKTVCSGAKKICRPSHGPDRADSRPRKAARQAPDEQTLLPARRGNARAPTRANAQGPSSAPFPLRPSTRHLAAQTGKALRCDAQGKRRIYCGKQSR